MVYTLSYVVSGLCHLCGDAYEEQPVLLLVCLVVDDLATRQARMAIEHLLWL